MTDTTLGKLVVEIVGDASDLINAYKEAEKQTATFESQLKTLGDSMTSAGKKMTLGVTAPLMLMGGLAVNTAKNFDDSMRQVQAVTGATGDQFDKLRQQAIDLGASTAWSASEVAEAQKYLAKAGLDVNQVMEATPQMLALASAGYLDLGSSADIATNILSGFDLEVSNLGHVSDLLAKAASTANTNVQQMGDAMAYVGPVASEANQSIEMTTAAIQIMSNSGIQGSMAGTALRSSLSALLSPTAEAQKILASYGLTAEDVNPEVHSLAEIVESLGDAGISAGDSLQLFGERGGPGMMKVVSAGREELEDYTDALEDCDGAALKMAETMEGGAGGSFREFEGQIETLSITFGDLLADALIPTMETVGELANWLSGLDEETQRTIVTIGLFAAAVGPATWALGSMAGGVSSMITLYRTYQASTIASTIATKGFTAAIAANPVGLAIIGVTTLAAVLIPLAAATSDANDEQKGYNESLSEMNDLSEVSTEILIENLAALREKIKAEEEEIKVLKEKLNPETADQNKELLEQAKLLAGNYKAEKNLTYAQQQRAKAIAWQTNQWTDLFKATDEYYELVEKEGQKVADQLMADATEYELELRDIKEGAEAAFDIATQKVKDHQKEVSNLGDEYTTLKELIDKALGIDEEIDDSGRDVERADIRLIQAKSDLQDIQDEIKELQKNKSADSSEDLADLYLDERSAKLDLADAEDRYSEALEDQQELIEEKSAIEEELNGESVESAQTRLDEISTLLEEETVALESALKEQEDAKISAENIQNMIDLEAYKTKSENYAKWVQFVAENPVIKKEFTITYDENGTPSYTIPTVENGQINMPEYSTADFSGIAASGVAANTTATDAQNVSNSTVINNTFETTIIANETDTTTDLANKTSKKIIQNALGGLGMG